MSLVDRNALYHLPPSFPSPSLGALRDAAAPLEEAEVSLPIEATAPAAPSLVDLARASGRGIESGVATGTTFKGAGTAGTLVRGHPGGKLWFDETKNRWRPLSELPSGYTVVPYKK